MPIIYKAYKEEDGNIVLTEAGSDLDSQLAENSESIELPGLQQQTNDAGTEIVSTPTRQIFSCSTRVYGYSDERWVAGNNTLGMNYVIHNSNRGTGAVPTLTWADMGILFPKGAKMKRLIIKGRTTNNVWTDTLVHVRAHDTDFAAGLPIDNSSEVGSVDIVSATSLNQTNNGVSSLDMHLTTISLEDYVFENDGDLQLYFKPVGNFTGTSFWYINFLVEFEV